MRVPLAFSPGLLKQAAKIVLVGFPGVILLVLVGLPWLDRLAESDSSPGEGFNQGGRIPLHEQRFEKLRQVLSWVPRENWSAASADFADFKIEASKSFITIHHSAVDSKPHFLHGYRSTVRGIQRFHMEDRGWSDIGYHFLIDPKGVVYEGRLLYVRGSHAGTVAANAENIGICLIGNFEEKLPLPAQLDSMARLLEALEREFTVERRNLTTHREVRSDHGLSGTACPGQKLLAYVAQLRGE